MHLALAKSISRLRSPDEIPRDRRASASPSNDCRPAIVQKIASGSCCASSKAHSTSPWNRPILGFRSKSVPCASHPPFSHASVVSERLRCTVTNAHCCELAQQQEVAEILELHRPVAAGAQIFAAIPICVHRIRHSRTPPSSLNGCEVGWHDHLAELAHEQLIVEILEHHCTAAADVCGESEQVRYDDSKSVRGISPISKLVPYGLPRGQPVHVPVLWWETGDKFFFSGSKLCPHSC
jgi:hypothetical protein